MNARITSAQIAELAGVSRATVSFVLNGHAERESIPAKTVNRILRIVREKNYRPNSAARAMRRQRFDCLSLLMGPGPQGSWLPLGLLRNLQRETASRDMHLNVSELPDSKLLSPEFAPKMLRELLADGLLVDYLQVSSVLEEMLEVYSIPYIWINEIRPNNSVYPDDFNGCMTAVEVLAGMGHRRIAYLALSSHSHYSQKAREQGFREATKRAGIVASSLCISPPPDKSAFRNQIEVLLRGKDRPTACIGYGSSELQITYAVALQLGLRVPQDLSLLAFDVHHPPLGELTQSSLIIPQKDMARVAVDLLVRKIAQPEEQLDSAAIPYLSEIGGESCAPPGGF